MRRWEVSRITRRACWPLTLAALALAGCADRHATAQASPASAAPAKATAAKAPPAAQPPPTITAREAWRFELSQGMRVQPEAVLALPDGQVLTAIPFEETLALPGQPVMNSAGGKDIAVVRLDPQGEVARAVHIAAPEDQDVRDLALVGATPCLALDTTGPLMIGEQQVSPPAPRQAYVPPDLGLVIALDAEDRPARLLAELPHGRDLRLAAASATEVVVGATWLDDEADPAYTEVRRVGLDGQVRWSRTLEKVQFSAIGVTPRGVGVATLDRHLHVDLLDAATGAPRRPRVTVRREPGADRGSFAGFVEQAGVVMAFGETGRASVARPNGEFWSHAIEPFTVPLAGDGPATKQQLVDATADVLGVGSVAGHPAAVFHAIFKTVLYGGRGVPHEGVYLAVGIGPERLFVPLYQVQYERDEPPRGPGKVLVGSKILPFRARVSDDAVVLAGLCGDAENGCVARYAISR